MAALRTISSVYSEINHSNHQISDAAVSLQRQFREFRVFLVVQQQS